jgi:cysteine desulfurase / selenocysteine lyase
MSTLESKVEKFRTQFPMLAQTMHGHPLVYLDSAATAQKPDSVIETIRSFYAEHYGTVHRAVYGLAVHATEEYQNARKSAQAFLNAKKAEEVIFTRGTTESINCIATTFGRKFIKPRDEILITEMEHHSNIVPWQMVCEEKGAILKVVPIDSEGVIDLNRFEESFTEKTRIAAFTHVSNALGTVNPVKEMVKIAHAKGAKTLVDGAQAAPHRPVDVQDLDADFYVFSGHKVYGPTGVGVLYGKEALLNELPPYQGGGDMIEEVTFAKTTYNVLPMKFEAGTPIIAEVIGLAEALKFLESFGREDALAWEQILLRYATEQIVQIPGVKIIGTAPEKGGILSFIIEGVHHLDIGTLLDLSGVAVRTGHHCAQPVMSHLGITGTARASFGLYSTKSDVDRFIQSLKKVKEMLCG